MKRRILILLILLGSHPLAAAAQDAPSHAPSLDKRVMLALTPDERVLILEEMHLFLDAVQKLTDALGRQDMPAAAQAARAVGQKMAHEVPTTLRAKLPMAFRQLGASTHRDLDQIAMDAETLGDVSYSLSQLSSTLQKCVSCHATYQIRTPAHNAKR